MKKLVALLILSLAACIHGPTQNDLNQLLVPTGVHTYATLGSTTNSFKNVWGELLWVDERGITVRTDRLVFVPFAAIKRAEFGILGGAYEVRNGYADPAKIERLKLVSRFPYGVSPGIMQQLLMAASRAKVDSLQ